MVLGRLCSKLSLRDLAEMFLDRGFVFTHEAVREWGERFAPVAAQKIRRCSARTLVDVMKATENGP